MPKIQKRKMVLEDSDLFTKTQERMDLVFENYSEVFPSFSGGKDSGLVLNMLLDAWERHGGLKNGSPLRLVHIDDEFKHHETDDYIFRLLDKYPDALHIYWVCLPVSYSQQTHLDSNEWHPWNPDMQDKWIRPMPDLSDYDNAELVTMDHPYVKDRFEFGQRHYDVAKYIITNYIRENNIVHDPEGEGTGTIQMTGIRTAESMERYSTIVRLGGWLRDPSNRAEEDAVFATGHPVYDWDDESLWAAHDEFDWDYNETYDKLYNELAYAPHSMRTAAVFGAMPVRSREMYEMRNVWPKLYERSERRLKGAHLAFDFGMDMFDPNLPDDCDSWQEFAARILNSMDEDDQEHYKGFIENRLEKHWEISSQPLADEKACPYCGTSWKDIAYKLYAEKNGVLQGRI